MALFLDPESFAIVNKNKSDKWPEERLLNQAYLGYYQTSILCEDEKSKLYSLFLDATRNSRKKIKRIKLCDAASANNLWDRIITEYNKEINCGNMRYYAHEIMPTMELVQWPRDSEINSTFNQLTRQAYISSDENIMYGTFIIPLIETPCSTLFKEIHKPGLNVVRCTYLDAKKPNPCQNGCICSDPISLKITENKNFFYLSILEPVDIFGEQRLNLYVHVKYGSSKKKN